VHSIVHRHAVSLALAFATIAVTSSVRAADPDSAALRQQIVEKGLAFFRDKGQDAEGTFSPRVGPGLTSLALAAALRNGLTPDDPMVAKGLAALEKFVKPDGGIYGNGRIKNYETCVAIVTFQLANKNKKYDRIIANAEKFVRGMQIGADGNVDEKDPQYGGVGYGGPERPDLSNTSYLIDALKTVDMAGDDDAIQRALVFVGRCQNLKGKFNDTQFADKVNDGGFYYVIPTKSVEESEDERYTANGGLRSYGSMSYSGFKSLIYAGLTKEDPRVKAVLDWIAKNYSVTQNPGVGDAGLYYYYNSFAAALNAAQLNEIVDADGKPHDWRGDLVAELAKRQNPDGSWTNKNRQWFENDPNLSTAFALIALSYCEPPATNP
jgi:squalene-hopene/tetraprenyl-beta-curcumene cyclase